jgi:hypothetical protein
MTDFLSQPLIIPAGETRILQGGGYFRLHESGAPLFVVFKTHDGANLAQGVFEEGEWARFQFGQVSIHNPESVAVNCKVRISKFESGSDQMAGSLTVTGDILAPVPVAPGVQLKQIGSTLGQNPLFAGRQFSVVFAAGADSYAINKIEIVTDVPVAVGMTMTTAGAVIAEGGTWSTSVQLGALPFGAVSGVIPYIASNIAAGVSAISDAAAAGVYWGTLQPGRHVIDLAPVGYFPAGHPDAMGITLKNTGAVAGDVTVIAGGVKV